MKKNRKNLKIGDVINLMEFGEYAVIVTQSLDEVVFLLREPSALYFDRNDNGILKSTKGNQPLLVGKSPTGSPHTFKILSSEEYETYLSELRI